MGVPERRRCPERHDVECHCLLTVLSPSRSPAPAQAPSVAALNALRVLRSYAATVGRISRKPWEAAGNNGRQERTRMSTSRGRCCDGSPRSPCPLATHRSRAARGTRRSDGADRECVAYWPFCREARSTSCRCVFCSPVVEPSGIGSCAQPRGGRSGDSPMAPPRRWDNVVMRRAQSASRSKPRQDVVGASRKHPGGVDESETGSANSSGPGNFAVRPELSADCVGEEGERPAHNGRQAREGPQDI